GARVVMQVHYHNQRPGSESDRTQIGLHFAKAPVDKRVRWLQVVNRVFLIPAGAAHYEVRASYTIPPGRNLHAVGISPHMHLLGRSMKVTATYPDGSRQPLIANRRNPTAPPRGVRWGEETTDEMCIAFVRVTVDAEK